MTARHLPGPGTALLCLCLATATAGLAGCSGSSAGGVAPAAPGPSSAGASASTAPAVAAASQAAAGGAQGGLPDYGAICPELPVADAQPLIRPALGPAVADTRLGGCTFVLPGNALNDNNLTVAFDTGPDASTRYSDDVHGTFTIGGQTMNAGTGGISTPLAGVGDKAVWGSDAGYPQMSALKGDVYCSVTTAGDATKLAVIGVPGNPLPQGTTAQQAQYAQLEGKLCTDLFAAVK